MDAVQIAERDAILRGAKAAFLHVMSYGWVADAAETVPGDINLKWNNRKNKKEMRAVTDDGFVVVDRWFSGPGSDFSFGTTTVAFQDDDNVVWGMVYWGSFKAESLPFLRQILAETYRNQEFVGGRGPEVYRSHDGAMLYHNLLDPNKEDFEFFSGQEVLQTSQKSEGGPIVLGSHHYAGMSLLKK